MRPYIVRQGEYVAKIASALGFDEEEVWNDAKNQELRDKRKSPWVLCPGDILYVPDAPSKPKKVTLEAENPFAGEVKRVWVNVSFRREGKPIANEECQVVLCGETRSDRTGSDGALSIEVPTTLREVIVELPGVGLQYVLEVGSLDPADEASGRRQRLSNLGLMSPFAGREAPAALSSNDDAWVAEALRASDEATVEAMEAADGEGRLATLLARAHGG